MNGKWENDNSSGQSCEEAAEADKHVQPSVTVVAAPIPVTLAQWLGFDRDYNRAIKQQFDLDFQAGKVEMIRAEIPLGPPGSGAVGRTIEELLSQAIKPSAGQLRQLRNLFAQQGRAGVEKALASFEDRLAEHIKDIKAAKAAGGYTSSMEREVRNFRGLIEAAKEVLGK